MGVAIVADFLKRLNGKSFLQFTSNRLHALAMNLNDSPEQAAFRAQVRNWIETEVPASLRGLRQGIVQGPGLGEAEMAPLEAALARKGWQAPHWPADHGGAGFDINQLVIFHEEWQRAGLPDRHTTGLDMLGPILIRYGTEAQKARFLQPIISGEMIWAQGYSEPQAGSDLAALQLRARVEDDGFVLDGQKIWTSKAHKAHWIFLLARTDPNAPKKQGGISFFMLDLKTPGMDIRPIETMDGFTHFCEVFFDNVKVPKDGLVGELNQGWTVAKALLGHERFTHPTANPMLILNAIENLKTAARNAPNGDGVMWDNPTLRGKVADLEMEVDGFRYTRYRALTRMQQGGSPGPETMIFKMLGAELMQRIVELHQQVEGPHGVAWDGTPQGNGPGETARHATNIRAATIRGGTSEVQRNIIAKRVLALPD